MARRFSVWYFSSVFFFVFFWVNRCVFPLSDLLWWFLIFCHIVYPFGFFYVFLVAIFYSKTFRFLLHSVVGMFSCHLPALLGRISFCCFGMSHFFCIVLPFVDISLIFLLSPVLSVFFFPQVVLFSLCCLFLFFSLLVQASFLCFKILVCFCRFFICVSSLIYCPGFEFSVVSFERIPIFS